MPCPRCHQPLPSDAEFCPKCGGQLALLCAHCETRNGWSDRFCRKCGRTLSSSADPEAAGARLVSPETYTPRHLAEKILTSKNSLEGERKQVTVLFADLKGSMELLGERDAEEARTILDAVLERMMEAVHRYEGTVNQVLGDGIMALFGAPLAHEDHAVRGCYAALRMQESMRRYAEEARRAHGIEPHIRVGLNSGEVVVRSISSDLHMDYTAIGQTTHLAARMEQLATPGSVRLTAATLQLAEGYVQVNPLGPVPVKGLTEPVQVYELAGTGPIQTRLQVAAARGLTPFVGRDPEMEQLRGSLERARAGRGQVVGVVGEAGVGKSRLFYEFIRSYHVHGWLVLEGRSLSYGKATPYLPLTELLKSYFKIESRDETRSIQEKVGGKILMLDRALEETLPAVLALLEALPENSAFRTLDPRERRQRTLEAIKRLLVRESQVQPLLVIFEDLHWIDNETQGFLESLVESLPAARLLLLVNYRPEYQHAWGAKSCYTQLRIDPLPPERAEELLHGLLGADATLRFLKTLLIERTEGNPFFLEESVHALVETHTLTGDRGSYRLATDVAGIHVPATVQAVLAARIDRLPAQEKRLLQTAAVVGKDVALVLLHAIAELSEEDLHRGLQHLRLTEFLYERSLFPEIEYTFKHALTHEVAYASLLQERRDTLHARIVEAMELLYADRLADHVERLAYHAFRGKVWSKARTYLRQSGVTAFVRSANREAVAYFEQALSAARHLPERPETIEQAIDLRFEIRNALVQLGEHEGILEHLREADRLAAALNDQPRLGRVTSYMAHYFWVTGDQPRAIESSERALTIAESLGNAALRVVANFYLGLAHYVLGEFPTAIEFLNRNVEALESDPSRGRFQLALLIQSSSWLGLCSAEVGLFSVGIQRTEEALRLAEAMAQPFSLIVACSCVGYVHLCKGDLPKAIPALARGLELCRVANVPMMIEFTAARLGYAHSVAGHLIEALTLLQETVEETSSMRIVPLHPLHLSWLSEAYRVAGDTGKARMLAQRAFDITRLHQVRGSTPHILRVLGDLASCSDPPDVTTAEDRYRQAIDLAEELGMRPLVAHCHVALGKLYRRTKKWEDGQAHLRAAATMFRDMDMRFWLEQAEAELKESA